MIDINELYNLVLDFPSKNAGQYFSPDEFNRYVNMASIELFDTLIGKKNNPTSVYGRNRTTDARLKPFRVVANIPLVSGVGSLPTNWEKTDALHTTGAIPIPVRQIDEDRFARIFDNPLDSPIAEDPIYIENSTDIQVYPNTITAVTIRYLKRPSLAVWGYTSTGRRPIYDPNSSTNLEWNDSEKFEILTRVLNYFGVSMKDSGLINYTENKQVQE